MNEYLNGKLCWALYVALAESKSANWADHCKKWDYMSDANIEALRHHSKIMAMMKEMDLGDLVMRYKFSRKIPGKK